MKHNQPRAHRAAPALTRLIALLLTVALAVACHNDPAQPQPNPDPRQPITLRLALPQGQPNTRVDYEDQGDDVAIGNLAGKLTWQEGDQITVTYTSNGTTTQSTFSLDPGSETTGAGHPTATFSGLPPQATEAGGTYTIDYQPIGLLAPYTDQELADDPTRQPQQQTGNSSTTHLNRYLHLSSDAFASLTDGTPVALRFSHSILKLRLRHLPADLGKLTSLRWTVETAGTAPDGALDLNLAGPTRSITLSLADAQADADGNFTAYLAFAPGQTSPRKGGLFSVRLTAEPGKSYTATLISTDGKRYAPGTRYTTTLGGTAADADGCHAPWQPTADGLTGLSPLDPATFNENNPLWTITGGDGTPETDELIATNVRTRLKALPQGSRIELTMEKVKTVGERAFDECTALNSVSLPAAESIGKTAFNGCTALTNIDLPAATSIENFAFYGCTALTTVSLPAATSIENYAFSECYALTTLQLTAPGNITLGDYAFTNFDTAACTLTLNPDKKSDATPKVEDDNKWWKVSISAAQWKQIDYAPAP